MYQSGSVPGNYGFMLAPRHVMSRKSQSQPAHRSGKVSINLPVIPEITGKNSVKLTRQHTFVQAITALSCKAYREYTALSRYVQHNLPLFTTAFRQQRRIIVQSSYGNN